MYDLFLWVLLISAAIFMIVAVLIIVALWRGRANAELPKQDFGSHRAEMFWMVGPVLVVLWIAAISAKLILTMNAVPKSHPPRQQTADAELTVIGHQWWWEVKYNGSGITAANEIHLPMGKKIRVKLESSDVIHCFWVPQLARKMDVIPGRENYIWIQADKPGVYQGRCAEFCGTQHAWMNFKVYVLDPQSYANWETGRKRLPRQPRQRRRGRGSGDLFFTNLHQLPFDSGHSGDRFDRPRFDACFAAKRTRRRRHRELDGESHALDEESASDQARVQDAGL